MSDCNCPTPEERFAWEKEQTEKHGWYMHMVPGEDNPTQFNAHTHHLPSACSAFERDVQIVIPLPSNIVQSLVWDLVAKGKEYAERGEKLPIDTPISEVLGGGFYALLVEAVETAESQRPVWRLILPDPDGNLHRDTITGNYALQYEDMP